MKTLKDIYFSKNDFIVFYLILIVLLSSCQILIEQPLEKIQYYQFMIDQGMSSNKLGFYRSHSFFW